jgi:hypothetical protein
MWSSVGYRPVVSRKQGQAADDSKVLFIDNREVAVELGQTLKAKCVLKLLDIEGEPRILANPSFTNRSNRRIKAEYHAAFFDREGKLIGCASQHGSVRPSRNWQFGSCLNSAPASELAKAHSYEIVLYEQSSQMTHSSEQKLGSTFTATSIFRWWFPTRRWSRRAQHVGSRVPFHECSEGCRLAELQLYLQEPFTTGARKLGNPTWGTPT